MKEGERMLKQMDLEITTNSLDDPKIKQTFNTYKKKIEENKSKYFKIKENYTYTKKMEEMILNSQRDATLDVNSSINSNSELNQGQKLLEREELMGRSDEKLQKVKRSAIELENLSKNVMIDLESQTGKLNATQSKLVNLNSSIEKSSSIITKMMSRENRNKAIVGVFSVTLLTFFLFLLSSRI
jgi:hypothetical protein